MATVHLSLPQSLAIALFASVPALVLASQFIPHDFSFPEMGALFTLSVYDVALALIGLSLNAALIPDNRLSWPLIALFLCALLPAATFTENLLELLRRIEMDSNLYTLPPAAVILTGIGFWAPHRLRAMSCAASAVLLGLTLGLFVGLEDLAISSFIAGSVASALWCLIAPGVLARHFVPIRWLHIAGRIAGSWLVVIGVIVLLSALLPPRQPVSGERDRRPVENDATVPQE
ncbi:hypothetical protein RFN29_12965 [Mesorhizobium sp. VK22B]|uniref:Uncharacterized protein n=1 Tax=Mesorhizobium captivum TaxID=3072319 RepID=A0ABU4YZW5_9HYPH|nr:MULTISPECIES: hypothetical protein [unclassified Mesorhizobium]MDX8492490.1 hypothetical protein [Mesorhizobium sp. VK22B]MDX8505579.1 hypothetical protein [Mesorhizobium sp. VK22E]